MPPPVGEVELLRPLRPARDNPIVGRGRVVIASIAVAVAVIGLVAGIAIPGDDGRSYAPEDVAAALNAEGLRVEESDLTTQVFGATNTAAFLPADGGFTVIVLDSDRSARNAFRQYEGDTDADTFELRAGNVLVLADSSNSHAPLPSETRRRIRRAVAALAGP